MKTGSDFCCDEHADQHKTAVMGRLMEYQAPSLSPRPGEDPIHRLAVLAGHAPELETATLGWQIQPLAAIELRRQTPIQAPAWMGLEGALSPALGLSCSTVLQPWRTSPAIAAASLRAADPSWQQPLAELMTTDLAAVERNIRMNLRQPPPLRVAVEAPATPAPSYEPLGAVLVWPAVAATQLWRRAPQHPGI